MRRYRTYEVTAMQRAIELARTPVLTPLPNPRVGAVIVRNKKIVAEGFHYSPGNPHAEADAIRNAARKGIRNFRNCEIFITLEPCCHTNKRTPPCAPLLIEKKFKRAVIAHLDPNPKVSGKGVRQLRSAGIKVNVGLQKKEAESLNQAFIKNQQTKLPYVTIKLATTFDGKTADDYGVSHWITSEAARKRVHLERAEADAIAVGRKTIDRDDPSLNVRIGSKRSARKVVIFGRPKKAFHLLKAVKANGDHNVFNVTTSTSLKQTLRHLYRHGISHLFVEGGANLASAFLKSGLVDRLLLFQGKGLLGGKGSHMVGRQWGLNRLQKSIKFAPNKVELLGPDILIQGSFHVYRTDPKFR
jgi:diaminohydroxyphosphoribosylaminopyrimidine deaminase/5-amino-6-(5-phosphoribosylamino)uracil reductase